MIKKNRSPRLQFVPKQSPIFDIVCEFWSVSWRRTKKREVAHSELMRAHDSNDKLTMKRSTRSGSHEIKSFEQLLPSKNAPKQTAEACLRGKIAEESSDHADQLRRGKAAFRLLRANDQECVYESRQDGSIETQVLSQNLVKLVWVDEPKNIFLLKKPGDVSVTKEFLNFARFLLDELKKTVIIEPIVLEDPLVQASNLSFLSWKTPAEFSCLQSTMDLVVCIGGDGTLLWLSSLFSCPVPPTISFALGSLGFLTPFPISTFKEALPAAMKSCNLTLRARLMCRIIRHESSKKSHEQASTGPSDSTVLPTVPPCLFDRVSSALPLQLPLLSSHPLSETQSLPSPKSRSSAASVTQNESLDRRVSTTALRAEIGSHEEEEEDDPANSITRGSSYASISDGIGRKSQYTESEPIVMSISTPRKTVCDSSSTGVSDNDSVFFCMNEVIIDRGHESALTNLDCYCDDLYFTKFYCLFTFCRRFHGSS